MLAKAASEFAKKMLAPNREENDKYPFGPFFEDALEKAFGVDFFHIILPEDMNGMNQGMSALSVTLDNICQEDSSLGGILFTNAAAQELMIQAGSKAELERICSKETVRDFLIALPVFNNPSEVKHLAQAKKTGDAYTLSGSLEYMVLGDLAGQAIIPASIAGSTRYSYFLVDLKDKGISKSEPILSLGLHACPAVDLELNHVKATLIGQEGKGSDYFEKMADRLHVAAASMALGVMKGSFKEAFDYAKKREQGGHEIINWSEVKMILSNMAIKISNAEMIIEKACKAVDTLEAKWETRSRAAALHIQDMACDLTTDGIQLLGGVGYMKDFGQEKRFRDAKHIQALLGITPIKKITFIENMI
ncbi:MAG: acyl-CoA dehydrogenase family protein [Proteobacteria bacterium]|nr:acyl-CoA dehydrogenase family protein [Pseudomonadota bacterium]